MRLTFGSNTLDLAARELSHDGTPVALEPRTYAVLTYLIEHRDRVVPKEELLDLIWGDRFVGESALTSQIKHARDAVGDDGRSQRIIRTAHRVGYRFVAYVHGPPSDDAPPAPDAASDPAESPTDALPTGGRRSAAVPRWKPPRTRLMGRDADMSSLRDRLGDHALVTITGPAGVGKTALAVELAERLRPTTPDGVWVCALAETRHPRSLGNVVLDAVGTGQHSDADPTESLVRSLEGRQGLLVLDNCEHLADAVDVLVRELRSRCPELRILATSRMPLGVVGESIHPLQPLDLDAAVACFAARATDVGAPVDIDDSDLAELCRRLDCLPLAVELAAARARLLSPGEMLHLLEDRFRLLRDGNRDDQRHASLYRAIEWSWDGLSPSDRHLLAELSVFVGSFCLDDVGAVASAAAPGSLPGSAATGPRTGVADRSALDPLDVVDALGRLVASSLVVADPATAGGMRFRLLESVREFAAEHLDGPDATRGAHARHYAVTAEALDAEFQTGRIDAAVADMGRVWPNLRAAVGYAADADEPVLVARVVRAVGAYADLFQAYEVLDWCDRVPLDVDALPSDPATDTADADAAVLMAEALAVKARMLAHRGHHAGGRVLADAAHQHHESHATLLSVVWCAYYRGDLDLVDDRAERLLELSRSDRGFDRGFAEGFAAIVRTVRQEPDLTSTPVTPAHAERGLLGVQDCLVDGFRLCTAQPEQAARLLEAVVTVSIERDYRLLLGAAASTLTQVTLPARPAPDAMRTLRHTLHLYLERGMWALISADTVMAAKLLADHDDLDTAARLLGAREASGYAVGLSETLRSVLHDDLAGRLGDRFAELTAQGATWRPPEAGRVAIAALDRALDTWSSPEVAADAD